MQVDGFEEYRNLEQNKVEYLSETKRDLFYILKEVLNQRGGTYVVVGGIRRVGKTILLKQLL